MNSFKAEFLNDFCKNALLETGVPGEQADIMSSALVESDLLGVKTHGISRLNFYIEHMENGTINPNPKFKIVSDFAAITLIDGDRALGPVVADFAMKEAVKKAREAGVGIVSVRNSSHMGTLSITTKKAAAEGMVGLAITNTSPIMAPWGGAEAVLGNNPISIAVPRGEDFPCVLDMALSVTARGNIILAARDGREIPMDWAVDGEGRPTTNAAQALKGAVLPLAQHKGYALAFMFDVLAGVLSGAAYGKDVGSFVPPDHSKPLNMGHFIMAIDIQKFMPIDEFINRLRDYVGQIKSSKKAAGTQAILIPGEIEEKRYLESKEKGIVLGDETVKVLKELADKKGIKFMS
ncbi:Ldh family oxidoreductase [Desulfitibacter alkalitolerans]|uniref:Ldh family oxidoreductase n=1 Tax=Desulfitibacter alkalitolerans TaxID=264641 RepID=UPI00048738D5|nr:Ldh family oxidoreductase [Desulfitibacter alkalitolerans]